LGVVISKVSEVATPELLSMISAYDLVAELREHETKEEGMKYLNEVVDNIVEYEETQLNRGLDLECIHFGLVAEILLVFKKLSPTSYRRNIVLNKYAVLVIKELEPII
jgi:hypothetical protein